MALASVCVFAKMLNIVCFNCDTNRVHILKPAPFPYRIIYELLRGIFFSKNFLQCCRDLEVGLIFRGIFKIVFT